MENFIRTPGLQGATTDELKEKYICYDILKVLEDMRRNGLIGGKTGKNEDSCSV